MLLKQNNVYVSVCIEYIHLQLHWCASFYCSFEYFHTDPSERAMNASSAIPTNSPQSTTPATERSFCSRAAGARSPSNAPKCASIMKFPLSVTQGPAFDFAMRTAASLTPNSFNFSKMGT
eukprot:m.29347 g.29347  ORF g.29347 m.29347 type:complete len:120 (+) comp9565_c0_seq1:874-1233(+)